MERPARHHEFAFALMMNRLGIFPRGVNPRLHDFQDEEVVFRHQLRIHDPAFQAGVTLGDQRSLDPFSRHGGETKFHKLVQSATGNIPASHDGLCQLHGGNVDYTFWVCSNICG